MARLNQERRTRGVIHDVRQLGDGLARLHVSRALPPRRAALCRRWRAPGAAAPVHAGISDVSRAFGDPRIGRLRPAQPRRCLAPTVVSRIEQRVHLPAARPDPRAPARVFLDQRSLRSAATSRAACFRFELAQLLHGLDADLRVPVVDLRIQSPGRSRPATCRRATTVRERAREDASGAFAYPPWRVPSILKSGPRPRAPWPPRPRLDALH